MTDHLKSFVGNLNGQTRYSSLTSFGLHLLTHLMIDILLSLDCWYLMHRICSKILPRHDH